MEEDVKGQKEKEEKNHPYTPYSETESTRKPERNRIKS